MIDAAISAAADRVAARERDVRGAFVPGFEPALDDVSRPQAPLANADPLCVAAPDDAWFATSGTDGAMRFTRDGNFVFHDGRLEDREGRAVFGFAPGERAAIGPLRLDPIDVALGRAPLARVSADGNVTTVRTSVDPRTGERRERRVTIGRVALARFPAGTRPLRVDDRGVVAPAGVTARFGVPGEGSFGALHERARDLGRVDLVVGLEKLRDAYDGFEALRAANHVRGSMDKTTMELLK